jgi:predicted lysophospholipase L1 biosynthesis ABC-type transport system permease subunit
LAALGDDIAFMPVTKSVTIAATTTWPAAHISQNVERLPVQLIAVATNGSASAIARAETVLDRSFPFVSSMGLFGEINVGTSQLLSELQTASEVVILASLLIAGCSLAVTTAAGLSERKRPFSLLRLTGVPLRVLRRVVALETAAPLIVIAIGSAAVGLVASDLFLRSQLGVSLRLPGVAYFVIVIGGLMGALAVISSTLPLLNRVTRLEDARTE